MEFIGLTTEEIIKAPSLKRLRLEEEEEGGTEAASVGGSGAVPPCRLGLYFLPYYTPEIFFDTPDLPTLPLDLTHSRVDFAWAESDLPCGVSERMVGVALHQMVQSGFCKVASPRIPLEVSAKYTPIMESVSQSLLDWAESNHLLLDCELTEATLQSATRESHGRIDLVFRGEGGVAVVGEIKCCFGGALSFAQQICSPVSQVKTCALVQVSEYANLLAEHRESVSHVAVLFSLHFKAGLLGLEILPLDLSAPTRLLGSDQPLAPLKVHSWLRVVAPTLPRVALSRDTYAKRKREKNEMIKQVGAFACALCDRRFASFPNLERHRLGVHDKARDFACEFCPTAFPIKCELVRHLSEVHGPKEYECRTCRRMFSTARNLRFHIASVHRKERKYPCSLCPLAFSKTSHLNRHNARKHPKLL